MGTARAPGAPAGGAQTGLRRPKVCTAGIRARHPIPGAYNVPAGSDGWCYQKSPRPQPAETTRGQLAHQFQLTMPPHIPWLALEEASTSDQAVVHHPSKLSLAPAPKAGHAETKAAGKGAAEILGGASVEAAE